MATRQQTNFLILVLAAAFTLSTMTSLRLPGVPIGAAELLLLGCLVAHVPLGLGIHGANRPNRFVPLLALMFLATLPGLFVNLVERGLEPWVLYSLISSLWVVVVFAYLHYGFDHGRDELEWLARLFLFFSCASFAIVLALALVAPETVYYEESVLDVQALEAGDEVAVSAARLQGFTSLPNQLAMHALVTAFFALALWRVNGAFVSLACLGLALAMGLMSRSDAFAFAAIALVGMWAVAGILVRRSVVLMVAVLLPAVVLGALALRPIVVGIQEVASTGEQDVARFALWRNGIEAGLEHPLTGLGPGIWSGLDAPREFEEAHNSLVDYFSTAGLPGTVLVVLAIGFLLWRALLSGRSAIFAGVCALLLYAMFHNVLRQPVFWLGLYYAAQSVWGVASSARRPGSGSRGRSRSRAGARGAPRPAGRGLPV